MTIREALKNVVPNLEIVASAELDKAHSGTAHVMYLRAEQPGLADVNESASIIYSQKALASNVVLGHNGYTQTLSSGINGVLIKRPYMWSRGYFAG